MAAHRGPVGGLIFIQNMTIETKYSAGDVVLFMDDNRVQHDRIHRIMTAQGSRWSCAGAENGRLIEEPLQIEYYFGAGTSPSWDESLLFPSKEALLASL